MNYRLNEEDKSALRQIMDTCALMTGGNREYEELASLLEVTDKEKKKILSCMTLCELAFRGMGDVLRDHYHIELNDAIVESVRQIDHEVMSLLKVELKKKDPGRQPQKLYISDLHFYHSNLNDKMDMRGFASHEEMNAHMVAQWNDKVQKHDDVFILGDFSIAKGRATNEILAQLKGKKHLVIGNHDKRFLEDKEFDKKHFVWIKDYAEVVDGKRHVVLSHYPVFCYNGQYRKQEGIPFVYMLYGHVHDTYDEVLVDRFIKQTRAATRLSRHATEPEPIPCNMINAFCMFSDYRPLSLDEWIKVDEDRRRNMG